MHGRHSDMSGIAGRGKYGFLVQISMISQAVVAAPTIRVHGRPLGHDVADELLETCARGIGNMSHPDSAEAFGVFHFHRYDDDGIGASTATLSSLRNSTHKSLIHLDRSRQRFAFAPHHRHTVPLQYRPGRSITGAQRSLQSLGRKTVLCGCQMPRNFEPSCERRPRLIHNSAGRH